MALDSATRSPSIAFGTKSETLSRLAPVLATATVLPLAALTVGEWRASRAAVLDRLMAMAWAQQPVIVRSSAHSEDVQGASNAGRYRSIAGVAGRDAIADAVDQVVASYGAGVAEHDQVFVQPLLTGAVLSGVAFSRDPNTGAPYVVVNYTRRPDGLDDVTAGQTNDLEVLLHWKHGPAPADARLAAVLAMVAELESVLGHDSLDIEFAVDAGGDVILLQVRPLGTEGTRGGAVDPAAHRAALQRIADKVAAANKAHPHLHGNRIVFGIMPDWNPAEIIGVRPRPLALSLYREMVTDSTWAYQRNNYGYKDLRGSPLMVNFQGLPYIDVRVSFNSFIPKDIEPALADKLANYYIDRLREYPALHDKVEFEIIFSCYTLDLEERLQALRPFGFGAADLDTITQSLRRLTNTIIHRDTGLWRSDLAKIDTLEQRRHRILDSGLDQLSKIYWLLEDCRRYGTLPFAGLARAGFIAVQFLKSLASVGVLSQHEIDAFMGTLNTVSSQMAHDMAGLAPDDFLAKYGHLRPGTYEIMSPRYDEAPEIYFDWSNARNAAHKPRPAFGLSLPQMRNIARLLEEHGLEHDVVGLFDFLQSGIEGREYSKFVFCRNLSDAMSMFASFAKQYGFSREDVSFADIKIVRELYLSSDDPAELLDESIRRGRQRYELARHIVLPPLITGPEEVWSFHLPPFRPNFITQKSVMAPVCRYDGERRDLTGAIVAIPSADPGFDWIFSHEIAGFVTAYGGVNSHMAIRASELGLPAVIGAGEKLYGEWAAAGLLHIDCANRQVVVLK